MKEGSGAGGQTAERVAAGLSISNRRAWPLSHSYLSLSVNIQMTNESFVFREWKNYFR